MMEPSPFRVFNCVLCAFDYFMFWCRKISTRRGLMVNKSAWFLVRCIPASTCCYLQSLLRSSNTSHFNVHMFFCSPWGETRCSRAAFWTHGHPSRVVAWMAACCDLGWYAVTAVGMSGFVVLMCANACAHSGERFDQCTILQIGEEYLSLLLGVHILTAVQSLGNVAGRRHMYFEDFTQANRVSCKVPTSKYNSKLLLEVQQHISKIAHTKYILLCAGKWACFHFIPYTSLQEWW